MSNTKTLKVVNLNCHSIRSKVSRILNFAINNHVKIQFLQETWLRKSDAAIISEIQEYNFCIFQKRIPHKIDFGRGVAILYNNSLKMKQIKVENFASFELVAGYLHTNAEKVTISTLYHPGYSTKHKFEYVQFLSDLFDFAQKEFVLFLATSSFIMKMVKK